jgi:hypothetical protein
MTNPAVWAFPVAVSGPAEGCSAQWRKVLPLPVLNCLEAADAAGMPGPGPMPKLRPLRGRRAVVVLRPFETYSSLECTVKILRKLFQTA